MLTSIYAHRGASRYAPENTMPAFELALKMNADGIETDVQLTKDNIPILIHDETGKRTTNYKGYINELTYSQVKELDAGSWFSKDFSDITILSLQELLTWIRDKPLDLNIELKNNKIEYRHLEEIVFEMVNDFKLLDRTTFSSFNRESVRRMKKLNPNSDVALLSSKRKKDYLTEIKELKANGIHIKYRLLNKNIIQEFHKNKMAVRVYTVNKPSSLLKCFQLQCNGIFTDVPDIALELRNKIQ